MRFLNAMLFYIFGMIFFAGFVRLGFPGGLNFIVGLSIVIIGLFIWEGTRA